MLRLLIFDPPISDLPISDLPISDLCFLSLRVGGGYEFDLAEFWTFVRAGADDFIKEAPPGVKSALEKLPQADKYVFTNCNEIEAEVRGGQAGRRMGGWAGAALRRGED